MMARANKNVCKNHVVFQSFQSLSNIPLTSHLLPLTSKTEASSACESCIRIIIPKSIFNPFLSAIFVVFLQKSHLNRVLVCFSLDLCCMDVPALGFAAWLVQELARVSSRTYCGCLRTSLRTKTVSSPNFHCFHNEWGLSLRISNGRRPFQMIFQIHIIYNNKHEYCHVFIKRLVF